ncbi:MAG: PTS fructose transporter subunit IIA [Pseudomonadota bacterium]
MTSDPQDDAPVSAPGEQQIRNGAAIGNETRKDAKARIGFVIVAHGALAGALLSALEHVVGAQPGTAAIAIEPTDDLHDRQREINEAVTRVEAGAGVVVVTDMFGGTPSNLALGAMTRPGVEVIYGANLPLLIKLAKCRDRPIEDAVLQALAAGAKYIDSAARMLDPQSARGETPDSTPRVGGA